MLGRLFLLFVLVPLLELALLIHIGARIGAWPTVGLVVATGVLGAWLARRQGLRVLASFQEEASQGRIPAQAVQDGVAVLIGGAFLLTPGVLTDLTGLALLFPPTRRWIQARARAALRKRIEEGTIRVVGGSFGGPAAGRAGWSGPGWEEQVPREGEPPGDESESEQEEHG